MFCFEKFTQRICTTSKSLIHLSATNSPAIAPVRTLSTWPLVTEETPKVTSPDQIKGIPGTIQTFFFSQRLGYPIVVDQNTFYKLSFFPPDHLLGFFRKSKPAIRVKFEDGFIVNDPEIPPRMKSKLSRSMVPMDYSFMRVNLRRLLKQKFLPIYEDINGRDGLYVFHFNILPTDENMELFEKNLQASLEKVKTFDCGKASQEANSRVDWRYLRKLLEQEGYEPPVELEKLESLALAYKRTKKSAAKKKNINRKKT